ncbi:DUF4225 domain-containing protein [Pseudomonas cannabina]|uniref:DUF4225 domain-containing protein n=2 Tax=Pseudomonas syringae group TaxID=136849 RepID=A0A8T8C4E1_PSEYM|nr:MULTISPECIES: DUF4225 domain-containing protein [Pseudomonas syringae group]MBM0141533.1 DUF4225 domain-containing protein [Pseudomonas cannabina pv. alisalensis]QHE98510.1 DUF4225 domain-containing protein [Pseudomonas syringae pv. maculicola str. ES4326]QQN23226.1 DUF4225 domain-containing protein [Pseudomonas cannabina pv. alisalensis]UBY99179.1 DUF4225 domain-containing protein [Pseudomonas cannabina pv. alisalensis]
MSTTTRREAADTHDLWQVRQAATFLSGQACTLSARHIHDGALRLQFNREVAYYARGIVRDVDSGAKSVDEGLKAIKREQDNLISQSTKMTQKGIGAAAGAIQITSGLGICYASAGTLCVLFGLPLITHGANNVYENGRNIIEGRSDTEGLTRKAYQAASEFVGGSKYEGNMTYGAVDLLLSGYGMGRMILRPDAWRLFRYTNTDYIRAYKIAPIGILTLEGTSNSMTLKGMHSEWKLNNE